MSMVCHGLWLKIHKWWTNEVRTSTNAFLYLDLAKLEANCSILKEVEEKAGCKVLLAQKGFILSIKPIL